MAKRVNSKTALFLIILDGKWKILTCEEGYVYVCRRRYASRTDAMAAAWGVGCPANIHGWLKLGKLKDILNKLPVVTPSDDATRPITEQTHA